MGGSALKLLLDTSVLIEGSVPPGHDAAISAVTIAATAIVHGAALMTHNTRDLSLIKDLVEIVPVP